MKKANENGKLLTTIVLAVLFAVLMTMPVFASMTPIKNFVEKALDELYWGGILVMIIGALIAYFSKNFTKLGIGLLIGGFLLFIIRTPEVIANFGSSLGAEILK